MTYPVRLTLAVLTVAILALVIVVATGHSVPHSSYTGRTDTTQLCQYTDSHGNGYLYTASHC